MRGGAEQIGGEVMRGPELGQGTPPRLATSLGAGDSASPAILKPALVHVGAQSGCARPAPPPPSCHHSPQVRSQALLFIKRMYEKEQLREYVEKFALNYLQLLVHPNPPSVLFGADKDTGVGTCRGPG